ncbi:hypothetical protein AVEN_169603-1 [Araneus ventricosus]|uniref:Uncharacterized protein n=1 Tax=Araneus ventricosus TaxID=182803 RepID=A0A4Y2HPP8_ARAVE|nr:hypothetical protein AVEN_169603-1 [Araneus ventricosus]
MLAEKHLGWKVPLWWTVAYYRAFVNLDILYRSSVFSMTRPELSKDCGTPIVHRTLTIELHLRVFSPLVTSTKSSYLLFMDSRSRLGLSLVCNMYI